MFLYKYRESLRSQFSICRGIEIERKTLDSKTEHAKNSKDKDQPIENESRKCSKPNVSDDQQENLTAGGTSKITDKLPKEDKKLSMRFDEVENKTCNQGKEILQEHCSFNTKLYNAIIDRQNIIATFVQLNDKCLSLEKRLEKAEENWNRHNAIDKIREKYWHLYMKDRVNALKSLHKLDETEASVIVMKYLKECYLYCRQAARDQMKALISLLNNPVTLKGSLSKRIKTDAGNTENTCIPEALKQEIIAFRRSPSENIIKIILKEFLHTLDFERKEEITKLREEEIKEIRSYVQKCVGVCWEMATQEPPMYLLFKLDKTKVLDRDKFNICIRNENKVDTLVWPALLLNEKGDLLEKGVVQATRMPFKP